MCGRPAVVLALSGALYWPCRRRRTSRAAVGLAGRADSRLRQTWRQDQGGFSLAVLSSGGRLGSFGRQSVEAWPKRTVGIVYLWGLLGSSLLPLELCCLS